MRHLLTLVSLLLVGSVWADDFNFNSPRAKAAMEKYQYDKEDLLRDLEAAFEHERTKGSLEEAIKIRDAIATLKQQPDAPVANAQIPADAVEWNGHYYKLFTDKVHFPKAAHHCAALGGHLIRIDSADENKFARKLAFQGGATTMWIDGTDSWADEGDWRYSNGQKMNYSNWPNHEPDGGKIENHVAMWENALWYADLGELWDLAYICEWDGPAGSTQRAKKIPADAVKYKGNYYKVYDEGMPHSVAKKRCEMMGAHLARIESADENRFLASLSRRLANDMGLWIDGSDENEEGQWRFSNGERIRFSHWKPGEPNNDNGYGHYIEINPVDSLWNDIPGGIRDRGFICEWEGDGDVSTGSKSIPADAVEWNGHHYWVSNEGTTWHEAKAKCEKMGGHLARITNQAEHNFIDRTLDQQIKTPIKQQKQSERDHWMDGERGADGVWRFSNGTKITYFNWHNDPAVPFPNTNDRWLFLGWPEANHGWANFPSGVRMGFICEWDGSAPETPTKPERTKPKPEEPIKKLSPKHAKRVLDDANLWEGKRGVWFLKRANNFSGRTYERLSQSNRIRSALASVNGRLPTPDEMNNPPSRR